jgi:hypothetical protein
MKATLEFDLSDLNESLIFRRAIKADALATALQELYSLAEGSQDIEWRDNIRSTIESNGIDINDILFF